MLPRPTAFALLCTLQLCAGPLASNARAQEAERAAVPANPASSTEATACPPPEPRGEIRHAAPLRGRQSRRSMWTTHGRAHP